jgi:hypothetical protein
MICARQATFVRCNEAGGCGIVVKVKTEATVSGQYADSRSQAVTGGIFQHLGLAPLDPWAARP